MANAVVYTLIATAFFIIMVLFSPSRQHGRDHRGLNRRLGYEFRITNFDPLVSKLERLAENRGQEDPIYSTTSFHFENSSFVDEVDDAYEYFSEGKLNTTLRLYILFPLIDKAPADGMVSFKELEAWFEHQAHQRLNYTAQKEMASRDKDVNGAIAFNEYLPQFFKEDIGTYIYIFYYYLNQKLYLFEVGYQAGCANNTKIATFVFLDITNCEIKIWNLELVGIRIYDQLIFGMKG